LQSNFIRQKYKKIRHKQMANRHNKNSFQKGIGQVKKDDFLQVKQAIMEVTGITSKASWYNRLHGRIIPNKVEAEAIEKIFLDHGITDVWG